MGSKLAPSFPNSDHPLRTRTGPGALWDAFHAAHHGRLDVQGIRIHTQVGDNGVRRQAGNPIVRHHGFGWIAPVSRVDQHVCFLQQAFHHLSLMGQVTTRGDRQRAWPSGADVVIVALDIA